MSAHRVTYGDTTMLVELGQPSDPILCDGESFGRQCADGRCETTECCLLAVQWAFDQISISEDDIEIVDLVPCPLCGEHYVDETPSC